MEERPGNEDDTVVIRRMPAAVPVVRRSFLSAGLGSAAALLLAAGFGAFWWQRRAKLIPIGIATEAKIDQTQPCETIVTYLAPDKSVVVIDFPSLLSQGLTLDRVAAFVEKADVPHNRVLDDAALRAAIAASGDTISSYYYGHDYRAADLARFFALAQSEKIVLNPQELWLKQLLHQLGWLQAGVNGAIITLPAAGGVVSPEMREVILRHEISHGAFYTVPKYRHYTEQFWASLTPADRAAFTGFLGRQGYDTSLTELMLNETQAYLIFTRDPRFFNAAAIGKTEAEVNQLRQGFIANMPDFWLTPLATEPLPPAPQSMPACPAEQAILAVGRKRLCLCYHRGGMALTERSTIS
ncbi:hypothetical protein [Acidocella sp.]|uniref:hypothetical protein n=1 Tax=Acidocella sp. TaxID=50710 RepID=UPI002639167C|nr:hypothetical protein [Acidocella sp.]